MILKHSLLLLLVMNVPGAASYAQTWASSPLSATPPHAAHLLWPGVSAPYSQGPHQALCSQDSLTVTMEVMDSSA